jgi:hypothetical protein
MPALEVILAPIEAVGDAVRTVKDGLTNIVRLLSVANDREAEEDTEFNPFSLNLPGL